MPITNPIQALVYELARLGSEEEAVRELTMKIAHAMHVGSGLPDGKCLAAAMKLVEGLEVQQQEREDAELARRAGE